LTKKIKIKFAQVPVKMGMSQAWLTLNNPGHKVMTYVLFQLFIEDISGRGSKKKFVCTNKDKIQILYSDLLEAPWNMQRKSVTRGIDELLHRGLIKVVEQGGSKKGHASIYGLSEEYLKWRPGDPPVSTRRPYVGRGFCAKPKQGSENDKRNRTTRN